MSTRSEILVGYNGSAGAQDALALAVPLAHLWSAGLHVVTAYPPAVIGGRGADAERELRAARTAAEGARQVEGSVTCRSSEIRSATTAGAMQELAEKETACVVLGRPRSRLHLGTSVTHKVLHGCPVPVAVPRRDLAPQPSFDRVVMAVDAGLADQADVPTARSEPADPEEQLEQLTDFLLGSVSITGVNVTVCALMDPAQVRAEVPDHIARAATLTGKRLDTDVEVLAASEAQLGEHFDSHAIVVHLGARFGAHGRLRPSPADLRLLHHTGPSLLVLPPPPLSPRVPQRARAARVRHR